MPRMASVGATAFLVKVPSVYWRYTALRYLLPMVALVCCTNTLAGSLRERAGTAGVGSAGEHWVTRDTAAASDRASG